RPLRGTSLAPLTALIEPVTTTGSGSVLRRPSGEDSAMVTIVTDVRLKEGSEQDWDTAMRERMAAAKKHAGWVGGQMLWPEDDPTRRVIVGTWQTRDDWERWHEDPEFAETREELEGLVMEPEEHEWHEVVLDVRHAAARPAGRTRAPKSGPKRKAS